MSRVEVLPGPERRRRWNAEQKQLIVAEAFALGASVCEVARRRDVVAGQIYRWRNELRTAAAGFHRGRGRGGAERAIADGWSGAGDRTRPGHSRTHCGDGARGACDRDHQSVGFAMIPLSTGVRVWIAAG